jgi:hypothetical protein
MHVYDEELALSMNMDAQQGLGCAQFLQSLRWGLSHENSGPSIIGAFNAMP